MANEGAAEVGAEARGEPPVVRGELAARGEGSSDGFLARDAWSLTGAGAGVGAGAGAGAGAEEGAGASAGGTAAGTDAFFESFGCASSAEKNLSTFFFLFMWFSTISAAFSLGSTGACMLPRGGGCMKGKPGAPCMGIIIIGGGIMPGAPLVMDCCMPTGMPGNGCRIMGGRCMLGAPAEPRWDGWFRMGMED